MINNSIMKNYIMALMALLTAVLVIALFYGFRHINVLRDQINQNTSLIAGLQTMLSSSMDTFIQPSNMFYQPETVAVEELSDIEEDSDDDDSDDEEDASTEEVETLQSQSPIVEHFQVENVVEESTEDNTTETTDTEETVDEDVSEMPEMIQKLLTKKNELTRKRGRPPLPKPSVSISKYDVGDSVSENGLDFTVTLTPSGRKKWSMAV